MEHRVALVVLPSGGVWSSGFSRSSLLPYLLLLLTRVPRKPWVARVRAGKGARDERDSPPPVPKPSIEPARCIPERTIALQSQGSSISPAMEPATRYAIFRRSSVRRTCASSSAWSTAYPSGDLCRDLSVVPVRVAAPQPALDDQAHRAVGCQPRRIFRCLRSWGVSSIQVFLWATRRVQIATITCKKGRITSISPREEGDAC